MDNTPIGKLRALMDERDALVTPTEHARIVRGQGAMLADLLPQIIAQMERDAKDGARYRWLRRKVCITSGGNAVAFHFVNMPRPQYIGPDSAIELDAAIDEAKERT